MLEHLRENRDESVRDAGSRLDHDEPCVEILRILPTRTYIGYHRRHMRLSEQLVDVLDDDHVAVEEYHLLKPRQREDEELLEHTAPVPVMVAGYVRLPDLFRNVDRRQLDRRYSCLCKRIAHGVTHAAAYQDIERVC